MLMVVWFWSVATAMMPSAASLTIPTTFTEMQTRTIELMAPALASATPVAVPHIMTLGWVDEDDAPIF